MPTEKVAAAGDSARPTTDFRRPFAMHLPRNEVASGRPLQMQARRLQFRTGDKTLPPRQLWGVHPGVLD